MLYCLCGLSVPKLFFICCVLFNVTSRLDYCKSLLFGISDGLLRRLQSVQNAAARLVTGARRCDHIIPVLRQLHWLPVRQRVVFKIAGLVHQSLFGLAPAYLADDCRLLSDVAVAHCGPIPMTCGSCLCHEHITNSVIGVSRRWSSTVEWPSTWTPAAGTCLGLFQTICENSFIWRPKRLVTLFEFIGAI